jgi:dodecin
MPRQSQKGMETERAAPHENRTAKVVELVGSSTRSFEDAIEQTLRDAAETTRGITGAHVENMSLKCNDGRIVEYKVNLKVAFGVERERRRDRPERSDRHE